MNSLYTQETSYMKMKTKYYIMGSINQDKHENEKYILHFMFSYTYFTYQISWIHVMKKYPNNISTCEETRNMIHDYLSRRIYSYIYIYIDYIIE